MRFFIRLPLCLALPLGLLTVTVARADDDALVATQRVRAHATFLADDLLEGRGAGTRGYDLAARYVASQFARIGLEPGADHGSHLQPMRLLEATNTLETGRFILRHDGREDALVAINDMVAVAAHGRTAADVTAPAVFLGFGVQTPELGHDDYAGVDLKGKIAVILTGAPSQFPTTQRAHHTSTNRKRTLAAEHGAVGLVTVYTPGDETRMPWAMFVNQARFPAMRLIDADGGILDGHPQLQVLAAVSRASAGRVLAASGHTAEEVFARAGRGESMSFPLNATFTLAGEAILREVATANVLGWLPGSDPALAGEPVVVTGHLDHLGIGVPVNGDPIYNGAMDNAVGIGALLAAAEQLAAGPRPVRPVLFAALGAEEKGLLGAFHLARHPPARVRRFAANVNVDQPLFPVAVRDLIAWGAEHTTLGALTAATAAKAGFTISPDPMPDETIFVRSDQYAFVRSGVPAIYLSSGVRPVDKSVDLPALWTGFLRQRYHKPSDDLGQPVDWPSTGAFATLLAVIVQDIANDPSAPAWLPGDFFGGQFGRKP